MITTTYKIANEEYQSLMFFNTHGEMLHFLGDKGIEFLINCDIEEINSLLKSFRIAKDLTLQDVGDNMKANYSRKVINDIESGRRKLGLTTLQDIAQSMGMEVKITFKGKANFVKELPYESDLYDEINPEDFEQ